MKKSFILIFLIFFILSFGVYADGITGACPGGCGCFDDTRCYEYDADDALLFEGFVGCVVDGQGYTDEDGDVYYNDGDDFVSCADNYGCYENSNGHGFCVQGRDRVDNPVADEEGVPIATETPESIVLGEPLTRAPEEPNILSRFLDFFDNLIGAGDTGSAREPTTPSSPIDTTSIFSDEDSTETREIVVIPFEYDSDGSISFVVSPMTYNPIYRNTEIGEIHIADSEAVLNIPIITERVLVEKEGYLPRDIILRTHTPGEAGYPVYYVAMIKEDGEYVNKLCGVDGGFSCNLSFCEDNLCSQPTNANCNVGSIYEQGASYESCSEEFLCIKHPGERGFCGEARNLNYETDVLSPAEVEASPAESPPSEEIKGCSSDDDCDEGYECGFVSATRTPSILERATNFIGSLVGMEPSSSLDEVVGTCKLISTAEIIEGSMRFRIVETGVVADSIGGIPSPDLEADAGDLGDSSEKLITLFEYDSDGNKVNIDYPVNYKFWYNDIITHTTTELSSTDSNDGILSIPATTTYIQVTKEGYLPRNVLIRDIEGSYAYSVAMIKSHFKYQSKQCSFYDECVSGICSGWLCIQSRQPRECSGRIVKEEENAGYGSCGTEFLCFKKSVATPNIGFCGEAINLGYYEPTGSAPLSDIDTSESLGSAPRVWQLDFDVLCYLDSTKVDKCSINGIEYRETGIDTREFYKWVYWLFENEDGERCSSDLDPNAADTCMFGNKIYTETGIDSKIFLSSDNGDVCTLKPNEVDVCIINGVRYVELALNLDYNSAQFRSFQTCSNFLGMINNCTVNNVLYTQESEGNEYYNTADGWNSITLLFTEDVNALDTDGVPDSSPGGDGTGGGSRDTCSQLRGCYATGGSTCQGGYIDNNAREANCCVPKKGDKEECGSDGECKSNICKNIHGDGECDGDAEVEYGCSRSEYNPLSGTTVNLLESECVDNDGDGLGKKTFKEAGEIIRQEDCTILPKSYKGKETSFYGILSLILSLGLIGIYYYRKKIKS